MGSDWLSTFWGGFQVWAPLAISFASFGLSVAAFKRSAPKIWPNAWLEVKGRGISGALIVLHIENVTDCPMRIMSLMALTEGTKVSPPPQRRKTGGNSYNPTFTVDPQIFSSAVEIDQIALPKSSVEFPFNVEVSPADGRELRMRTSVSISAMRSANNQVTIDIPIDIPAKTDASSPTS